MSKDSSRSPLHLHRAYHADLFEDFTRIHLAPDEIYVPPHHQPINPEDEDDVVPDQHAAFGITRATQRQREPAWQDLGLEELMRHRPGGESEGGSGGAAGTGSVALALRARRTGEALLGNAAAFAAGGGVVGGSGSGGSGAAGSMSGSGGGNARGEGANQLPR